MLLRPHNPTPIQSLGSFRGVEICIKREDMVHPAASGNKFWKLYYNIGSYLHTAPANPLLITFGGAFSNHISSVAALGCDLELPTLGIIRGEELKDLWQQNPTLQQAATHGMHLRFVSRKDYRDKTALSESLRDEFPDALILPEGGTNPLAVEGFRHVLDSETAAFDYICTPVGTGGTLAGLSKFAEDHQKLLGFSVVRDASQAQTVKDLSGKQNFEIIDASFGGYGKINDEVVAFVNSFYRDNKIPLDPIYTGKMMLTLMILVNAGQFAEGTRILAIHSGGLQGIAGANRFLIKNNREAIYY